MSRRRIEHALEVFIFASRWVLAPLYLGLVAANALLIYKFAKEFINLITIVLYGDGGVVMASILSLVDIVLLGNLLVIIIFAGYENFVSKIDTHDHVDRPDWMGLVGFSDLKMKVIGSIVAISGIELLKSFVDLNVVNKEQLTWKVIIHITFVLSGIGFAVMDKIGYSKNSHK